MCSKMILSLKYEVNCCYRELVLACEIVAALCDSDR